MDKIIPFEKSFASSGKAQYWSKKNTINPEKYLNVQMKNIYLIVIIVLTSLI